MNRKLYIERLQNNLNFLNSCGILQDEQYMRPLCMRFFSEEEKLGVIHSHKVNDGTIGRMAG